MDYEVPSKEDYFIACTYAMLLVLLLHIFLCTYSSVPHHDLDLEANIRAYKSWTQAGPNSSSSSSRHHGPTQLFPAPVGLPKWFRPVDSTLFKHATSGDRAPFNCTKSRSSPAFRICVHRKENDKYISAALLSSGVWEPFVTRVYQHALTLHPDAAVVDVGANIGYYTLLAAAMGHSVVAVEPQHENLRRLAEAARAPEYGSSGDGDTSTIVFPSVGEGKTDADSIPRGEIGRNTGRILLLANAVSDGHKNVSLTTSADNQGGVRVIEDCGNTGWFLARVLGWERLYRYERSRNKHGNSQQDCRVTTITMDDLLRVLPSSKVVIKVDIEGYECRALATARRFFSAVQVPYIFMEWRQMRERQHDRDTHCSPGQVSSLALFLAEQGYVPHEVRSGVELNPAHATGWVVGDVYWRAAGQKLLVPSW